MRTIDELPLPSFTTMSHEIQKDTLRLPTYRESVLLRFHPYTQVRRKKPSATSLMQTIDRRYSESCVVDESVETAPRVQDDVASLDRALQTTNAEGTNVRRKRSLTSLIIDLALAVKSARILGKRSSTTNIAA